MQERLRRGEDTVKRICLKRQSGIWYVKSHCHGITFWAPAGTLDRAIMMAGGH